MQIYNVVIGTAGHIDHGKSAIVKRLTGIDPDRLPEEKEREMTIDIGFANLQLKNGQKVGIIDVPGHEDFIKNMLAGATGIDIALLVVSATDGIMLQTVEHLHIMNLLGIKKGIIVINKIDLADDDLVELLFEDIKSLCEDTFLRDAPVLKVSAQTGDGFDKLCDVINETVLSCAPRDTSGIFRMPIQRVFAKKGFGTVITGVPVSGRISQGEMLEVLPLSKKARVKGLHAYMMSVKQACAGHSSALNIDGVQYQEVKRGDVAATPDYFKPSRFIEARFKFIPEAFKDIPDGLKRLKSFMPVKFHVGTKEAEGQIVILDKQTLDGNDEAFIQLRLVEDVIVAEGDRFILRVATPEYTIGGGEVINVSSGKVKRFKDHVNLRLLEKSEALADRKSFIEFVIIDSGFKFVDERSISISSKLPLDPVVDVIKDLRAQGKLVDKGRHFIHAEAFKKASELLITTVCRFHEANPLKAGILRSVLRQNLGFDENLFEMILQEHLKAGRLVIEADKIKLPDFKVKLSREDEEIAKRIEAIYRGGIFQTPRVNELDISGYDKSRVHRVVEMLVDQGVLVRLKGEVLLHRDSIKKAQDIIVNGIKKYGPLEPSKIRDLLGTTRKYVIPLLEYMDSIGFTVRRENKRVLKEAK